MQTTGMLPSTTASQTYKWHETEGVKIVYREAGPAGAPVIVLLHGYPSTAKMYAPLIPLLATRYRIIAPDYPGFGLSDAPEPDRYTYSFDNIARTLDSFLSEIGVGQCALYAGLWWTRWFQNGHDEPRQEQRHHHPECECL